MNPKMRIQLLLALEMIERDIPARRGAHHSECWLSGVRFTKHKKHKWAYIGLHFRSGSVVDDHSSFCSAQLLQQGLQEEPTLRRVLQHTEQFTA
jgi:hypothetical protein